MNQRVAIGAAAIVVLGGAILLLRPTPVPPTAKVAPVPVPEIVKRTAHSVASTRDSKDEAPPPPDAIAGASISGRITDKDTGQPIASVFVGAHVPIERDDYGEGYSKSKPISKGLSGADGTYTIPSLLAGKYVIIREQTPGYGPANELEYPTVELQPAEARQGLNFELAKGFSVRGRVVNEQGQPIEFAQVSVSQMRQGTQLQTTDEKGEFVACGLAPSWALWFDVTAPSYSRSNFRRTSTGDKIVPLPEGLDVGDLTLDAGASVEGTVLDADGNPQPGVEVTFQPSAPGHDGFDRFVTDERGVFHAKDLYAGRNSIGIHESDEVTEIKGRWLELDDAQKNVELAVGDKNPAIVLTAAIHVMGKDPFSIDESEVRPEMTTGYVVDERGNPVVGAYVSKYVKRPEGVMDCGDGLGELFCDTNTQGFFGKDFGKEEVLTIGVSDQKGPLGGQLFPNIKAGSKGNKLVMKDLPTIGGHVVDDASGEPIRSYAIRNSGLLGNESVTDPNGRFSYRVKFAGEIKLYFEADGHTPTVFSVEDPFAPEAKDLTVRMSSGCKLAGIVRDENGQPAQYARISDNNHVATTAADGSYTLTGILAGPQTIHLNADNYAGRSLNLSFTDGQMLRQDFVLVPCGKVRGQVDLLLHPFASRNDYINVERIRSERDDFSGGGRSGHVQADGSFEITQLPPGEYQLKFDLDGDHRQVEFHVTVRAGETVDMGILQAPAAPYDEPIEGEVVEGSES